MEVKIVTIEGIVFESMEVTSITIPTTLGVVTVLEDHQPLFAILEPGAIEITIKDNKNEILAVSRGILEVRKNSKINILADTAEKAESIDVERAMEAIKRAEEYLKTQDNLADIDFAQIQAKLAKELARIEVGKRWRKIR